MNKTDSFDISREIRHFSQIWQQRPAAEFEIRHTQALWDQRAGQWARDLEDEATARRVGQRVEACVRFIRSRGGLRPEDRVIDIGCGPGRFVTAFAQHCRHATGTDLSQQMLEYGRSYAQKQGVLEKTDWVPCDFQRVDLKAQGWEKNFDLVFASITPAIDGLDGLRHMMDMSRWFCFNSCYIKSGGDLDDLLFEALQGEGPASGFETHLHWFYSLANLLLLNGYLPLTEYYTEEIPKLVPVNWETADYFARVFAGKLSVPPEALREKIMEVLKAQANGAEQLEYRHTCTYGFLLWDVNR